MAKRRKLTAPSAEDLDRIEDEFRRETSLGEGAGPRMAPIAQVAAETARSVEVVGSETRARLAEAEQAAERYREAEGRGLVLREIPLEEIREDALFRDRMTLLREELDELRDSIVTSGMRMPVELFELPEPEGEKRYGLISGYRRLLVMREIHAYTENPKYARIRAIIRQPKSSADSFAAIAEENEVRSSLSHFERGRFAALTASNGVFGSVEEAVERLFPFASKAKRSKVRSFALIFEEIGDMLSHPEALTEKQGLRLSAALRGGAESELRDALAGRRCETAADEWQLLEEVVEAYEETARDRSRGGRPAKRARPKTSQRFRTTAGISVAWDREPEGGYVIRLKGRGLDADLMDSLLAEIRSLLGKS